LQKACSVLEKAILAAKGAPKRVLAALHCEAAYFYAEQFSQEPARQIKELALSHYDQSWKAFDGNIPARNQDSLGYVLIQTGETVEEIQRGLEMSTSAIRSLLQGNAADEQTRKAGEFFLKLHTDMAYKRMSELASADCDSAIRSALPFRTGEKYVA
jgi:hypothetical protein